jgi:pyruvate formate lyase activating enzyme
MTNIPTLELADYREKEGKPMWLRYVMVPGYNDTDEVLHRWGERFTHFKTVERVELLPYHTLGAYKYAELGRKNPLEGVQAPDEASIHRAKSILEDYFTKVTVH